MTKRCLEKFLGVLLIFLLFLVSACSNKQSEKSLNSELTDEAFKTAIEELQLETLFGSEYIDHSDLLLTFSSSTGQLREYPIFKLGIVDITVVISVGEETYRQSLYNKAVASDLYLDSAVGVDLTHTDKNSHLYHGIYSIPAGKLEKFEIAFSGSKSDISVSNQNIRLIDSLFSLFRDGNDHNPDQLDIQTLPIIVETTPQDDIEFFVDDLKVLNIHIDKDMTISLDAAESETKAYDYAVFTPSFHIEALDDDGDFVKPFHLSFKEYQYVNMGMNEEQLMVFGNPQQMLFIADYSLSSHSEIYLDGSAVEDLMNIDNTHYVDLKGEMTIDASGYHYTISKGHFFSINNDQNTARYEGTITGIQDDKIQLNGQKNPLVIDDYSLLGGSAFNQTVFGYFSNIELNDKVVLLSDNSLTDSNIIERLSSASVEDNSILEIQSSVIDAPLDMMNINSIHDLSTTYLFKLTENVTCSDFITNIKNNIRAPCSSNQVIQTIQLM